MRSLALATVIDFFGASPDDTDPASARSYALDVTSGRWESLGSRREQVDPPRLLSPHGNPTPSQCRSSCARHCRCSMGDVVRGLRQALLWLVSSAAVALIAAGVWFAVQGGGFRAEGGGRLGGDRLLLQPDRRPNVVDPSPKAGLSTSDPMR